MREFFGGKIVLYEGDCLERLAELPDNSIDSCTTDPPYHLQSIVKRYSNDEGISKKGRRILNGEDAHARVARGFMGKKWDGGDIAFRPELWAEVLRVLKPGAFLCAFSSCRTYHRMACAIEDVGFITHPFIAFAFATGFPKATRINARGWEGWRYGTQALKPALEPIYVGQKPFSEKNGTANVLRWGVGAINIDGCRIRASEGDYNHPGKQDFLGTQGVCYGDLSNKHSQCPPHELGRWPANLCHDGSEEVTASFPKEWGVNDYGSPARFFYTAKADSDDRLGSKHPTCKPVDLMQWLVRMITTKGGMCLDPFAGTGTTAEACFREGMRCILIEREDEYIADIERRMALILAGPVERSHESIKARGRVEDAGPLFGGGNI